MSLGQRSILAALIVTVATAGCGGGGGGGTSVTPNTGPAVPPATAAPATPTPASTLPPSTSASILAGASAQTALLSGIASGFTGTISIPATTSGSGNIALAFATALPPGPPSLASVKRVPATIGVQLTAIAYVSFTPATTITLPTSPGFSFTLAPGFTLPPGASSYVAYYDPQSANGWVNLAGPGAVGTVGTYTHAANPAPMTFTAGTTYVFAWYATASLVPRPPTPAPTSTPAPAPTPVFTPFPGGATLVVTFTANVPASARTATIVFGSTSQTVPLPTNCSAPSCTVTVSAPVANGPVQVQFFAPSTTTPLAIGTASAATFQNQSTTVNVALVPVMNTLSLSLNPATVTIGRGTAITLIVNAIDAAGDIFPTSYPSTAVGPGTRTTAVANFVTTTLVQPSLDLSTSDPSSEFYLGTAGIYGLGLAYFGIGSGPATITAQATVQPTNCRFCFGVSVASASASLNYVSAPLGTSDYATSVSGINATTFYGLPGSGAPPRTIYRGGDAIAFDPSGTLWMPDSIGSILGVRSDGTSAGDLSTSGNLLTFDLSGNLYTLGAPSAFGPCISNLINSPVINEYRIANGATTLIRSITAPTGVSTAAVAPDGTLYAGTNSGVFAYGPSGNGAVAPIATNANATTPVATDTQGNVYAVYAGTIGKWPSGTFGSSAPAVSYTPAFPNGPTPLNIAVDTSGNVFVSYISQSSSFVVYPAGSTSPTTLQPTSGICNWVAAPLR